MAQNQVRAVKVFNLTANIVPGTKCEPRLAVPLCLGEPSLLVWRRPRSSAQDHTASHPLTPDCGKSRFGCSSRRLWLLFIRFSSRIAPIHFANLTLGAARTDGGP